MTLTLEIETGVPYRVHVGPGVLAELDGGPAPGGRYVVVSDENVAPLYRAALGLEAAATHVVPAGEGSKSFAVLEELLDFLVAAGLDRSSTIVALGGGVVGDLAGLAASLFMRGIDFVQCPTSLLAMVDSSVGGKTAVNLSGGKNLAGTFHQPRAVFADTSVLGTLPASELASGLGEVLKSALIGDPDLLEFLRRGSGSIERRDPDFLAQVVQRSIAVKGRVVSRDEFEAGERKQLNLGHTFAHGIEHAAGYGTIPHGIAVAVGLLLALEASQAAGLLVDATWLERTRSLVSDLGLPGSLAELRARYGLALSADQLLVGIRHDKKGSAGRPRWVLVRDGGDVVVDCELDDALVEKLLA